MKKQLFLSFTSALAACAMHAQVLNSGFENLNGDGTLKNWEATILLHISLGTDSTSGAPIDTLVTDGPFYAATTDAHSGNYAMEMRNAYYSESGEQVAGRADLTVNDSTYDSFAPPLNSEGQPTDFTFYYKFLPAINDTAYAYLRVFNSSNDPIGEATVYISGTTGSYTLASAPVAYTSTDTAAFIRVGFITAKTGTAANFGTRFLVDDIQVLKTTTGISDQKTENNIISCFPNPASQQLNLRSGKSFSKETSLCITDLLGKQIENISYRVTNDVITADVEQLPAGVYMATVTTGNSRYTTRFVK